LVDIPEKFREKLNFIPVKFLDEVIEVALDRDHKSIKKPAGASAGTPRTSKKPKVASPAA
jgi:ATP-dependent Lon protease